jgi:hypothetical protein
VEHKSTVFTTAYFGAIIFTLSQDKIEELVKSWKKQTDIVRFLVIALPPVAVEPHRPPVRRVATPAPVETTEPKAEKGGMTAEAMDKEIDSLLVSN